MSKTVKTLSVVLGLSLVLGLPLAAQAAKSTAPAREISDPIEPVNRFIFGFNDILDRFLIEPLAKGYKAVVPHVVRDGIQNFVRNLEAPVVVANQLLQGKVGDAGVTTARFVLNSTIGVAGLVDVASAQGLNYKDEDFGQTLATWGVGNGPYIVLPVLGPSSLRDAGGLAVDSFADPVRIYADNTDHMWIYYTKEGLEGLDTRSRLIEAVDDMRSNSLDYYATARSAYVQKRYSLIRDEQPSSYGAGANSLDHP